MGIEKRNSIPFSLQRTDNLSNACNISFPPHPPTAVFWALDINKIGDPDSRFRQPPDTEVKWN